MSAVVEAAAPQASESRSFGLEPNALEALRCLAAATPGIAALWVFGSRAQGTHRARSDLDLAVDAPDWDAAAFEAFGEAVRALPMVYPVDLVHWQRVGEPVFRAQIEAARQALWPVAAPRPATARHLAAAGGFALKPFQEQVLAQLDRWLAELGNRKRTSEAQIAALSVHGVQEESADLLDRARDFPLATWNRLQQAGHLPPAFAATPHTSRFDGARRPIPNACLRVPTGGGKTLLAAAAVGRIFQGYLGRDRGLVLWVVPNDAIYRQTLSTLKNTDHPYRQLLNLAGAGRVKILEKETPFTRMDVESHLCVMVLMLAATARQNKDTLRFFRDRGSVLGFLPAEDDIDAHWALLREVPNLDVYASLWQAGSAAQKGSIVKSSLGNVVRLLRPLVIVDEGQKGYSETALSTIDGFNPSLLLELSATPRVVDERTPRGSNILVDVRGTDLDAAEMIKLPIDVRAGAWGDWRACLAASVAQLRALSQEAEALQADTQRYIRPILLVQVERVGKEQTDPRYVHARDVREHLLRLGFGDAEVREKTSEKDEIAGEALLSPASPVRIIITKQALQEGWDCPFAYVLCALAPSRAQVAMTQLVGRILRLPHAAKTGRAALDACYVLCHDQGTGAVVETIRAALEGEGMGDLASGVRAHAGEGADAVPVERTELRRRPSFDRLRVFVPMVTWTEPGTARRPLDYEADILSALPWERLDAHALAAGWTPGALASARPAGQRLVLGLDVLRDDFQPQARALDAIVGRLDRTALVAGLLDVVPNPWRVWGWLDLVLHRILAQHGEAEVAASAASLAERLRADLESERDRLAEAAFLEATADGRIEFRLRADGQDYELPHEESVDGKPKRLLREDGSAMEKSLLAPAVRTPDLNDFEAKFAGYLDEQPALAWWHRNVARTQYGLQGWKRHRVYPDFVFGFHRQDGAARVVLLETKGDHLAGNADTGYKQALLARLTEAYRDERFRSSGELALSDGESDRIALACDLVFENVWRSHMDARWFAAGNPPGAAGDPGG